MHTDILVVGLGVSGRSVASYLLAQGSRVWACDQAADRLREQPEVALLLAQGLQLTADLPAVALAYAVLSPGIALEHPYCRALVQRGIPLIGEVEFACQRCLHYPMIGITGTNGKTTVTLQIAHTLTQCGIPAQAMGNVGIPLTQLLAKPAPPGTIIVLELSSYQLEALKCRCLDAALLLNVTPDHLDRYPSLNAYAAAKWQIGTCLKPKALLYVDWEVSQQFPHAQAAQAFGVEPSGPCQLMIRGGDVFYEGHYEGKVPAAMPTYEQHNLLGIYAICRQWGLTLEQVLTAAGSFAKPPHRQQYVASVDAIDFYDDSKGTNVDAVLKAVQALKGRPIHLIAGGVAKGASFVCWQEPFRESVVALYVFGASASQLVAELSPCLPVHRYQDLSEAVAAAYAAASPGDAILLSPGCASTDMFRDYAHRGQTFQAFVHKLRPCLHHKWHPSDFLVP